MSTIKSYKDLIVRSKRQSDFVLQRLVGYPLREAGKPFDVDNTSLFMCPYTRSISQYLRFLNKRIKVLVPCGRCMYCRHKYQNGLIYRLYNHDRVYKNRLYVTLTYNNEHYIDDVDIARQDITKFIKRFRKELNDRTMSYYLVCERGDLRDRLHFHLLLWWNGIASVESVCDIIRAKWFASVRDLTCLFDSVKDNSYCVPRSQIGYVYIDTDVNSNIMTYVSKYVSDKGKKLMFRSWSLGLGATVLSIDDDLVSKMRYLNVIEYMPAEKVYRISIPSYYKQKIFKRSELDCFFYDYLMSEDYARKWEFYEDKTKMYNLIDIYLKYEKRVRDAYYAQKVEKMRKKRLL